MANVSLKDVLEILTSSNDSEPITLEDAIREDFGEAGLDRFRDYEIQLELPNLTELKFERHEETGKKVGETYNFSLLPGLSGIMSKRGAAQVYFRRSNECDYLSLTLDLNPESEKGRYLNIRFGIIRREYHDLRSSDYVRKCPI